MGEIEFVTIFWDNPRIYSFILAYRFLSYLYKLQLYITAKCLETNTCQCKPGSPRLIYFYIFLKNECYRSDSLKPSVWSADCSAYRIPGKSNAYSGTLWIENWYNKYSKTFLIQQPEIGKKCTVR